MQYFVISKPFEVIFTNFFAKKQKLRKFKFLRGEPYFLKKLNIHSPSDEHAMVLRYSMILVTK